METKQSIRKKLWRESNKERIKETMKLWRERNKEHVKEYAKEYKEQNKDHIQERQHNYDLQYYQQNKDRIKDRIKKYQDGGYRKEYLEKNREILKAKKRDFYCKRMTDLRNQAGGKCVKCGSTIDLDFHHVDPLTKEFDITRGVCRGLPLEKIKEEIKKCELWCSKCHDGLRPSKG